jgi:hypothetical protein
MGSRVEVLRLGSNLEMKRRGSGVISDQEVMEKRWDDDVRVNFGLGWSLGRSPHLMWLELSLTLVAPYLALKSFSFSAL